MDKEKYDSLVTEYRHQTMANTVLYKQTHVGSALTTVPLLVKCYFDLMKRQDKMVFSKGHGGVAFTTIQNAARNLRAKIHSHPEKDLDNGIEFTLGSLGHGLGIGLGEAFASPEKKIYVLLSDGDLDEGSTWESIRLAGELFQQNLIAIVDANGWQNYKENKQTYLTERFKAFGWDVQDTTDDDLYKVELLETEKPQVVIVRSIKGKGLPGITDGLKAHYFKISQPIYEEIIRSETKRSDEVQPENSPVGG